MEEKINETVIIFADIEACGNIVEKITDSFFVADIATVSQKRIPDTFFVVDHYTFLLLSKSNIGIFRHSNAPFFFLYNYNIIFTIIQYLLSVLHTFFVIDIRLYLLYAENGGDIHEKL